ncbi:hypothetical protein [Arenibaculum sp.]|jgi:hypothetical protein|uniref:hypothetical protein n=1 Tax=Arenibaculum sp. TaxID=2865862 RepID=UPI002E14C8D9|nr:hypothetical protein [Arenibaculum sp.]
MAVVIGGIPPHRGADNHLVGTGLPDVIFGDPYTTGNDLGVPEVGGILSSGRGGNDRLEGLASGSGLDSDFLYGDAWEIAGKGRGGNDRIDGGPDMDRFRGDAEFMSGAARGGNDRI